jgi:hypothetical protein
LFQEVFLLSKFVSRSWSLYVQHPVHLLIIIHNIPLAGCEGSFTGFDQHIYWALSNLINDFNDISSSKICIMCMSHLIYKMFQLFQPIWDLTHFIDLIISLKLSLSVSAVLRRSLITPSTRLWYNCWVIKGNHEIIHIGHLVTLQVTIHQIFTQNLRH